MEIATLEKVLAVLVVLAAGGITVAVRERLGRVRAERAAELTERERGDLGRQLERRDHDLDAMETVLSSMGDGVVLIGSVGGVRLVNPAAERLLGGRPATLAGIRPSTLQAIVRTASGAAETEPAEVEVGTGRTARSIHAEAVPVGDGSVLLILRDVTESVRLERIRRDLVANASHELKTPAASIQAAAETIRRAVTDDPDAAPRFAEQLEKDARRLSRIVSDLLDLSRLEGGSELHGRVALGEVLREECGRFAALAAEADVSLRLDANEAAPPVRGSERDLALLVGNLLDNAIRYTGSGGSVEVALGEEDGRVALTVRDTGIGIPSRDIPRIFERFYRVDRARSRETGGTGLGLSIVRHVVENHGGSIEVESELGRGTTFRVLLPAAG